MYRFLSDMQWVMVTETQNNSSDILWKMCSDFDDLASLTSTLRPLVHLTETCFPLSIMWLNFSQIKLFHQQIWNRRLTQSKVHLLPNKVFYNGHMRYLLWKRNLGFWRQCDCSAKPTSLFYTALLLKSSTDVKTFQSVITYKDLTFVYLKKLRILRNCFHSTLMNPEQWGDLKWYNAGCSIVFDFSNFIWVITLLYWHCKSTSLYFILFCLI